MRFSFGLALVATLVVLELGIRTYDFARGASVHARAYWYWGFTQDRLLGYRPRANVDLVFAGGRNHLDTNSDGFRDDETRWPPAAGTQTVVCVGESSTFGTGSSSRRTTWPNLLERRLASRPGPSVVVLNAGIPGFTTVENVELVQHKLLKYRPRIILYMGMRNDLANYMVELQSATGYNLYPRPLAGLHHTWANDIVMRSSIASLIATQIAARFPFDRDEAYVKSRDGGLTEAGVALFRDRIALLKALTDRNGIQLLWIDQPIDVSKTEGAVRQRFDAVRGILHEELVRLRIPLLEANSLYDFAKHPMIDEVHFTDEGNAYLADLLAPQIVSFLSNAA